jgi:hypothetical protein
LAEKSLENSLGYDNAFSGVENTRGFADQVLVCARSIDQSVTMPHSGFAFTRPCWLA